MNKFSQLYNNRIIITIILLILIEPGYFTTFGILHRIYIYGAYAIIFLLLGILLINRKFNFSQLWIILFYGASFISTIIYSKEIREFINSNSASFAMCLLFVLCLNNNVDVLLDAFATVEAYVYINFVTMLIWPDGMYNNGMYDQCWFLGYKNVMIRIILPIVAISLIRTYRKHDKLVLSTYMLIGVILLTIILSGSTTALVGIGIFILLMLIYHKKYKKLPKIFSLLNGLILTVFIFIIIIIMHMEDIFSFIIVDILGKDLTFHTRRRIWDTAVNLFKSNYFLGYGYMDGDTYAHKFGNLYATHPHNYFLYIALTGGVVLILIVFIGYFVANKKIMKTINTIYSKIILFTLFVFLIMGLTESLISTVLLYPMLLIAMNLETLASLPYKHKRSLIKLKRIIIR